VPSLTVENYVKAIYAIATRRAGSEDDSASTGEIAAALGVSPGSVTGMLKTLSESKLATYTPYEGVRLTEDGRRLALKVLRRHRLIEQFLTQTLAMSWDEVHEEAEHMEHVVSDRLIDRIDAYLGHPQFDPHGDPIPQADGSMTTPQGVPLSELPQGSGFQVVRVVDQDSAFLRYLSDCGLDLGTTGILQEKRKESGAIVVQVQGRPMALGFEAAGKVLVTTDGQASRKR
jgi:DtxR family Mn-dependent transcriptional regulator